MYGNNEACTPSRYVEGHTVFVNVYFDFMACPFMKVSYYSSGFKINTPRLSFVPVSETSLAKAGKFLPALLVGLKMAAR
jgi:hypothetical protein